MRATTFPIGASQAQAVLGPGDVGAVVQADPANGADIYLGGQYVTANGTATDGVRLSPGSALAVDLAGDDILFAIAGSGTQLLRILQGTRVTQPPISLPAAAPPVA